MNTRSKSGSALLVVIGFTMLLVMGGAAATWITGQSAFTSRKQLEQSRALAIAEAGVADVLAIMSTNYEAGVGVTYTNVYNGGRYVVSTSRDLTSGNVLVTSTGTYRTSSRRTRLELLGDIYQYWASLVEDAAIIAGGDATLETAAPVIVGRVHANGNIFHSTGNLQIDGNLTAGGIIELTAKAGYVAITNHPELVVPSYFPIENWKAAAQSGGLYYSGNQNWRNVNLTPANGIVYVDGDVEINNRSTLAGTLIATGSISINNRFDQTLTASNMPALIAGVNINLLNRNRYDGIIWAGNNIVTRNNKIINGALIALNNIYLENKAQLPGTHSSPDWNPDGTPEQEVIVGGWVE